MLFKAILIIFCTKNNVRRVDFISYSIWDNVLGFEWGRLTKLQKRALRIITNSKYNAHTEPLFKDLYLLKIKDIFDVQCMKFYNSSFYDMETRHYKSPGSRLFAQPDIQGKIKENIKAPRH